MGDVRDFKEIYIKITTNWFNHLTCETCGKKNVILAGLPSDLRVKIPLTDEEYQLVATNPFWINGAFDVTCINGFSHIATGSQGDWIIASEETDGPAIRSGEMAKSHYSRGSHFEKVLTEFIPGFINLIHAKRLT